MGPRIHMDVTLTFTTYLKIVADHVHSFMATVFPGSIGLLQQDDAPCHTAKFFQEWFKEQEKEFNVLSWPPDFPISQFLGQQS